MPSTMMNTQQFPAGWYPTDSKGGMRYWDGYQWSAFHRAERPGAASHRRTVVGLVVAGLLAVATVVGVVYANNAERDSINSFRCAISENPAPDC